VSIMIPEYNLLHFKLSAIKFRDFSRV